MLRTTTGRTIATRLGVSPRTTCDPVSNTPSFTSTRAPAWVDASTAAMILRAAVVQDV